MLRKLSLFCCLVAFSSCSASSEDPNSEHANKLAEKTAAEVQTETNVPKHQAIRPAVKKRSGPDKIVWDCTYSSKAFSIVISEVDYNPREKIPGRIAVANYQIRGENPLGVASSGNVDISEYGYQLWTYSAGYFAFEFTEDSNDKVDQTFDGGNFLKCNRI